MLAQPGPTMSLAITFDEGRFDSTTVTRMLGDFQALLRDMVADPDQRILNLPKASASTWSGTTPEL